MEVKLGNREVYKEFNKDAKKVVTLLDNFYELLKNCKVGELIGK